MITIIILQTLQSVHHIQSGRLLEYIPTVIENGNTTFRKKMETHLKDLQTLNGELSTFRKIVESQYDTLIGLLSKRSKDTNLHGKLFKKKLIEKFVLEDIRDKKNGVGKKDLKQKRGDEIGKVRREIKKLVEGLNKKEIDKTLSKFEKKFIG